MFCVHPTALPDKTPSFPSLAASLQCGPLASTLCPGRGSQSQTELGSQLLLALSLPGTCFADRMPRLFSAAELRIPITVDSGRAEPWTAEPGAEASSCPCVSLAFGKELSLEEMVPEAASADDRCNPQCCSLQSHDRPVPVRTEPQPSPLDSQVFCDVPL